MTRMITIVVAELRLINKYCFLDETVVNPEFTKELLEINSKMLLVTNQMFRGMTETMKLPDNAEVQEIYAMMTALPKAILKKLSSCGVADKEEDVHFVSETKPTYIPDTNCFIHSFDIIEKLLQNAANQRCFVAIPFVVNSELDGLSKNAPCAKVRHFARKSIKLLSDNNDVILSERATQHIQTLETFKENLRNRGKLSTIILTDDKNMHSKANGWSSMTPNQYNQLLYGTVIKTEFERIPN